MTIENPKPGQTDQPKPTQPRPGDEPRPGGDNPR